MKPGKFHCNVHRHHSKAETFFFKKESQGGNSFLPQSAYNPFFQLGNGKVKVQDTFESCSPDNTYKDSRAYKFLKPEDAMWNAASYATVIRQIYYNGAHGPGETC